MNKRISNTKSLPMKRLLFSLALLLAATAAWAQNSFVHERSDGYQWPDDPLVLEKLAQWQDLKFGVLMHWGLYSVPGIVARPTKATSSGTGDWQRNSIRSVSTLTNGRTYSPMRG